MLFDIQMETKVQYPENSIIEDDSFKVIRQRVIEFAAANWELGRTHVMSHWRNVERNGHRLAVEGVNLRVVSLFAYLHDKWRRDNYRDINHEIRAAHHLVPLRNTLLKELTDEEFDLLYKACKLNTVCHHTGDITIDTCFDADRLDLIRCGIQHHPRGMATERGKQLAKQLKPIRRI